MNNNDCIKGKTWTVGIRQFVCSDDFISICEGFDSKEEAYGFIKSIQEKELNLHSLYISVYKDNHLFETIES